MGAQAPVKYHYSYRFFTYSVKRSRGRTALVSGVEAPSDRRHARRPGAIRSEDSVRRGV